MPKTIDIVLSIDVDDPSNSNPRILYNQIKSLAKNKLENTMWKYNIKIVHHYKDPGLKYAFCNVCNTYTTHISSNDNNDFACVECDTPESIKHRTNEHSC